MTQRLEDSAKERVMKWFLSASEDLGLAAAAIYRLPATGNFSGLGGVPPSIQEDLREVYRFVAGVESEILSLEQATLSSEALEKVPRYYDVILSMRRRPGRLHYDPKLIHARPLAYFRSRRALEDRVVALQVVLGAVKEYLESLGIFGFGPRRAPS